MASQRVIDLRLELEEAKAKLLPELEGMRDFSRLNISDLLREKIDGRVGMITRRINVINSTLTSLSQLDADGYPDMEPLKVTADDVAELQDQLNTLGTAFGRITTLAEAVAASIKAGQPVEK